MALQLYSGAIISLPLQNKRADAIAGQLIESRGRPVNQACDTIGDCTQEVPILQCHLGQISLLPAVASPSSELRQALEYNALY